MQLPCLTDSNCIVLYHLQNYAFSMSSYKVLDPIPSSIQSQIFHFLYYTEPQWDDVSSYNIMAKTIHSLLILTTFFLNFALTTKCYFLGAFTTLGTTGSLCPFSCAHTTSWVLLNRCPYNFLLENFTPQKTVEPCPYLLMLNNF